MGQAYAMFSLPGVQSWWKVWGPRIQSPGIVEYLDESARASGPLSARSSRTHSGTVDRGVHFRITDNTRAELVYEYTHDPQRVAMNRGYTVE